MSRGRQGAVGQETTPQVLRVQSSLQGTGSNKTAPQVLPDTEHHLARSKGS